MQSLKMLCLASAVGLALPLGGCNNASGKTKPKPAPSATTAATQPAPAASTAEPAPQPEPKPERPKNLDTQLTQARREKIDKAHPEAKGFLVLKELEGKLKKNKGLKAKAEGMRAFDRMAKGHWVLFTGPMTSANAKGFELGVTYTPRMKGDTLGLSRQFFLVKLADIKGYDPDVMKSGTMVVVLARYQGKGKAGPGFELISEHDW